MLEIIQSQLKYKFPQLVNAFGEVDEFLRSLATLEKSEEEIEVILYKILSHSDTLVVLSPTNIGFNLYDNFLQESINISKPYSVYNLEGDLCYQVSNHEGKFGFSPLDRFLILEANNLDFYYLSYEQEDKETRLILLVIYKPIIFEDYSKVYFPAIAQTPQVSSAPVVSIPNVPSGFSVIGSSITYEDAVLQWNISFETLTLWKIRYKKVSESTWTFKDITYSNGSAPSTKLSGLSFNTEYQAQIQSINSAGASAWSSTITFKTCKENNDLLDPLPSSLSSATLRVSLLPTLSDISGSNLTISQTGTTPIVKTQERWGIFIQSGAIESSINLPISYTKACWIYFNNLNEDGNIFSSTITGKEGIYLKDGIIYATNDTSTPLIRGYKPISNEWIFLCVTYSSSTQKLRMYANGTLVLSDSGLAVSGSTAQRIGKSPSNSGINGFIGNDILLFNSSLTAFKVQELYQFQLTSEC